MATVCSSRATFFIVTVLFLIKSGNSLVCLSCDNVDGLEDCQQFMECAADEACYVDQYLDEKSLTMQYRAGCRKLMDCNLLSCAVEYYGKEGAMADVIGPDLTTCTQCCYNDACNVDMCGSSFYGKSDSRLSCFNCDVGENETCLQTTQCQTNEKCLTQFKFHGSKPVYHLGCYSAKICDFLEAHVPGGTRDSSCCEHNLCNVSPYAASPTTPVSVNGMTCPPQLVSTSPSTPQPTTTITTTPAPTTTTVTTVATTLEPTTVTTATTTPLPTTSTKGTPGATPPTCVDRESNCAELNRMYGLCQVQSKAKVLCVKTCNLCHLDPAIIGR